MQPELSRRVAQVIHLVRSHNSPAEVNLLIDTVDGAFNFESLPKKIQSIILDAEKFYRELQ